MTTFLLIVLITAAVLFAAVKRMRSRPSGAPSPLNAFTTPAEPTLVQSCEQQTITRLLAEKRQKAADDALLTELQEIAGQPSAQPSAPAASTVTTDPPRSIVS